jgi:aminoglycoside phosphotransferase
MRNIRFAKLHQARIHATLEQELGVLIDTVVVHSAACVPTVLVA